MKIALLSDTRVPTKASGSHGLGRVAWDLASGLAAKGHRVSLFAGKDSDWGGPAFPTLVNSDEKGRAEHMNVFHTHNDVDVYVDLSHGHDLSRFHPDWPILNYLMDLECPYRPPRAVVGGPFMQAKYGGRIVPLGIDVDAIPFADRVPGWERVIWPGGRYLAFCHKLHATKGVDLAAEVGQRSGVEVRYAGPAYVQPPDGWVGEITSDSGLYEFLGNSLGLLSPAREDAGGRVNLESAACGTPVLCFDWTGTRDHVAHGVSGFVCATVDEMVDAVADLPRLDRRKCREWVAATHSLRQMIDGIETLAEAAREGERW